MTKPSTALVNPERLFGVVKRMYTGNPDEILGEMLQNAQRAGADRIDVRIDGDRVTFSDNGSGISEDLEGFRNLLSIADSKYSKVVEIEQSPMGIGFYSLLSHADVSEVRVETGGKSLAIDTRRWFADSAYRQIWPDLLGPSSIRTGMVIEADCGEKLLHEFACLLKAEWWSSRLILRIPPWVGYGKLLSVTCNGTQLPSELPKFLTLEPLIETEYQGNQLTIGFSPEKHHQFAGSYVNWFGQLISIDGLGDGLNLHLEVTGNNPSPLNHQPDPGSSRTKNGTRSRRLSANAFGISSRDLPYLRRSGSSRPPTGCSPI